MEMETRNQEFENMIKVRQDAPSGTLDVSNFIIGAFVTAVKVRCLTPKRCVFSNE
jgi:hypothetical protein